MIGFKSKKKNNIYNRVIFILLTFITLLVVIFCNYFYYETKCEVYKNSKVKVTNVLQPVKFLNIKNIKVSRFFKCIIIIPICSYNSHRRNLIRSTWSRNINRINYFKIFYLGNGIINNIVNEKDILQFSFFDSYFNLTIGTLLTYHWTMSVVNYFDYIIKIDSDVYPNIGLINLFISLNKINKNIIYGYYYPKMKTSRNINNSNYISYNIYPHSTIPDFVAGSFYIFPKISKWKEFIESFDFNSSKLIYREDIQLGLNLKKNNINIIQINKYYNRKKKFNKCKDYSLHLAVHGITSRNMFYIFLKCN